MRRAPVSSFSVASSANAAAAFSRALPRAFAFRDSAFSDGAFCCSDMAIPPRTRFRANGLIVLVLILAGLKMTYPALMGYRLGGEKMLTKALRRVR